MSLGCSDKYLNELSEKIVNSVKETEDFITQTLLKIASKLHAKLVGLDFKIKSVGSLKAKLTKLCENETKSIPTWDVLRYTFIIDISSFDDTISNIDKQLMEKNIVPDWQGNYFCDGNIYKGLNRNYKYNELLFEIQYHTEESFNLKQTVHEDYETYRDPATSKEIKCQIFNKLVDKSNEVKNPIYTGKTCYVVPKPTECINGVGGGRKCIRRIRKYSKKKCKLHRQKTICKKLH